MFDIEVAYLEEGVISISQERTEGSLNVIRITPEQADLLCQWIKDCAKEVTAEGKAE